MGAHDTGDTLVGPYIDNARQIGGSLRNLGALGHAVVGGEGKYQ
jgi:hypothetical protein